jgi:CMP-N-acetylneuraminic acid synthetase
MIKELSANSIEKGFLSYVLPKYRAIDIDDEDDWVKAEFLFRANKDNLVR